MKTSEIRNRIIALEHNMQIAKQALSHYTDDIDIADLCPADFFAMTCVLSAQQKAIAIERYVIRIYGGVHVPAAQNRGDFRVGDVFYEVKISTANVQNCLNIRQIRLYQDVDWYVCAYIDETNLSLSQCFRLSKDDMRQETNRHGGYSHGTGIENVKRTNAEYSITIPLDSDLAKSWHVKYDDKLLYDALTRRH
jgi:hypothetical protein